MNTVRIYLPYGAHLRFEGVDSIRNYLPDYISFLYKPKDHNGEMKKGKAEAVFALKCICGYSMEEGS